SFGGLQEIHEFFPVALIPNVRLSLIDEQPQRSFPIPQEERRRSLRLGHEKHMLAGQTVECEDDIRVTIARRITCSLSSLGIKKKDSAEATVARHALAEHQGLGKRRADAHALDTVRIDGRQLSESK